MTCIKDQGIEYNSTWIMRIWPVLNHKKRTYYLKLNWSMFRKFFLTFALRWYRQFPKQVTLLASSTDFQDDFSGLDGFDWSVQVFRSITSDSSNFSIDRHELLESRDGKFLDKSIQVLAVIMCPIITSVLLKHSCCSTLEYFPELLDSEDTEC